MDVRERKKEWRRLGAEMFGLLDREARAPLDAALCERVKVCALAAGARKLLAFSPLPDEPDIRPFLRQWLALGGALALPVWRGGGNCLLRWVGDPDAELRPGRGGILEPAESAAEAKREEIELAVAPGRFFSERCDRLGRGAGVYDALFRGAAMKRVGICYDFQVVPAIPASENDVPMDMVLTPSRIIKGG